MEMMDVVDRLVEVELQDEDDFLRVIETLTRIGVSSKREKKLFQSCHILHKKNKYYIVHFKELFLLDGKMSDFSDNDRARRNKIVALLDEWGLITVVRPDEFEIAPISQIKVIPYKEKEEWELIPKYNIGKRK
jgi:hypothetical protein